MRVVARLAGGDDELCAEEGAEPRPADASRDANGNGRKERAQRARQEDEVLDALDHEAGTGEQRLQVPAREQAGAWER